MSHRLINIDEAENMIVSFQRRHTDHKGSDCRAGTWGLVISCPVCGVFETAAIDNDAYRDAPRQLKKTGVITF